MARSSRVSFEVMVADARREGFYRSRDLVTHIGRWATKCETCGAERIWNIGDNAPIEALRQFRTKAGWQVHKGKCTCPTCVNEAKMSKIANAPTANNNSAALETSMKLQRKVYTMLDEHFDEDKRLYRDGWSDKKIADAVGTAPVYVETVRRAAYGELAEDPILTALKKDIGSLGQRIADTQEELLKKFDELEKKHAELKARTDNLALRK